MVTLLGLNSTQGLLERYRAPGILRGWRSSRAGRSGSVGHVLRSFRDHDRLPFPQCPRWRRRTTFLCNALLEATRFLCSLRSLEPQRCCRWTDIVFNFSWSQPLSNGGHQDDTRAWVHVHGTRADGRVTNSHMVSAPSVPAPPNSRLFRVQTLNAEGMWPASEVDLTTGCDARRANWPAQRHWSRIRKKRHYMSTLSTEIPI